MQKKTKPACFIGDFFDWHIYEQTGWVKIYYILQDTKIKSKSIKHLPDLKPVIKTLEKNAKYVQS